MDKQDPGTLDSVDLFTQAIGEIHSIDKVTIKLSGGACAGLLCLLYSASDDVPIGDSERMFAEDMAEHIIKVLVASGKLPSLARLVEQAEPEDKRN